MFFKKKKKGVFSVCSGKIIDLALVNDEVFKSEMLGKTIAISPSNDVFKAPADGELNLIHNSNHAYAMTTDDGLEILVHIGIDTVSLNGKGMERLINDVPTRVKKGDEIIRIDREFLIKEGKSVDTFVVLVNDQANAYLKCDLDTNVTLDDLIFYK